MMFVPRKINAYLIACCIMLTFVTGCARDLSSKVYTSDASLNLVLEGKIIKSRPIIIKNHDKLANNTNGMIAGGAMGGVLGGSSGDGGGVAIVAGVLAGAIIGSLIESNLGTADGIEYIVQIDRSKLSDDYYDGSSLLRETISSAKASGTVAVIQSKENPLPEGQNVYVIISPKRARVIAK